MTGPTAQPPDRTASAKRGRSWLALSAIVVAGLRITVGAFFAWLQTVGAYSLGGGADRAGAQPNRYWPLLEPLAPPPAPP